jgi:phage-related protein (TIGR01555 family)
MASSKKSGLNQRRNDSWGNVLTGSGIRGRDKSKSNTYFADCILDRVTLTSIYRGDGIGRRIVDLPTHDMYREWFTVEGDTDGKILKALRRLRAKKWLKKAQRWGYLYGGSVAVLGIDDGNDYDVPVNENAIKAVTHIHVFDRHRIDITIGDLYDDPAEENFGLPKVYHITPIEGNPFTVHESRVLRYEGIDVDDNTRQRNQGWGDSVLQACYTTLSRLGEGYNSIGTILSEFIIGMLTIDNLEDLLLAGKDEYVKQRLSLIDLSKHIINTILLDTKEKFERTSATVSGLEGLMDKLIEAVSATSGIPITLLMGRSVAGLSDAETGQIRFYYDKVAAQQEEDATPQAEKLVRYINIAEGNPLGEDWQLEWKPLWQPTQAQMVDTRLKQAQTDQIYHDMDGGLLGEEIIQSRFGGDSYSHDTRISDAHKKELEAFDKQATMPKPPPEPVPVLPQQKTKGKQPVVPPNEEA